MTNPCSVPPFLRTLGLVPLETLMQQEACRAEIGSMGSLGQIVRFTVQSVQIGAGRSGGQTGGDSLHQGLRHEVSLIPAWVRTSRATGAKNTSPPHRLMPS